MPQSDDALCCVSTNNVLLALLLLTCFCCPPAVHSLCDRPKAGGVPRSTRDLLSREWELSWPTKIKDVRTKLAIYDRFVPVIGASNQRRYNVSFLEKRQSLFNDGCYPGVEYRIKDIEVVSINSENATKQVSTVLEALNQAPESDIFLKITPAYPLIPQLERKWPVRVPLSSIPWCLSRGSYNVVTVASSALLASSFLLAAFVGSLFLTLSVVNTRSMQPTIQPKDVILVEKVTPALKRAVGLPVAAVGDIIFFKEPKSMAEFIARNHYPAVGDSDLIVKRISGAAAAPAAPGHDGDAWPSHFCLEVRGDNPAVSVDSRDWGCLPSGNVVGTPLARVWPIQRAGLLK